jgi:hypothetical protein
MMIDGKKMSLFIFEPCQKRNAIEQSTLVLLVLMLNVFEVFSLGDVAEYA